MRDELRDWAEIPVAEPEPADDPAPPAPRPRGPGLLRIAAVVPWAVVALLILLGQLAPPSPAAAPGLASPAAAAGDEDATGPAAAAGDEDATGPAAAAADPALPDPAVAGLAGPVPLAAEPGRDAADEVPALLLTEVRGGWAIDATDGDVAAVAVAVARAWLTGLEPRSPLAGIPPVAADSYVEHLAVETVERPGPDAAVVRLLAVLLTREAATTTVHTARLSVPLAFVDGVPRPAGSPWWAGAPDLRPVTLDRVPIDDPDLQLAALDALHAAGFTITDLIGLEATDHWPRIATVTGTGPDGRAIDGEVWLRPHLHGFVVAGASLTTTEPAHEEDDA